MNSRGSSDIAMRAAEPEAARSFITRYSASPRTSRKRHRDTGSPVKLSAAASHDAENCLLAMLLSMNTCTAAHVSKRFDRYLDF